MAVAATAALPAYEVLIASGAVDRRELCAALAVRLKELPLRIEVRVLPSAGDPFADEPAASGALCAAVLVLGPAAASASYALEQLYNQLVERCGQRLLVVFSGEPLLGAEPTAAASFAAFRARLRERHHTRVLPQQGASAQELGRVLAGFVCALLCEELGLRHAAELEQRFAEPEDASPARLAELLASSKGAVPRDASGAAELAAPADSAAGNRALELLAAAAAGETELDPLREPARARALEQRREGLRAFAIGEDAVAIGHLRAALRELPLDAPSGYWLARLLLAEGGRVAAAEASRMAQRAARVAASAGRPEAAALAHAAAARAEAVLGHPQQAEQQARAAAVCAPWLAEAWVELACQCLRRGELEAGERALREAFQRDPRALLRLNRELPPGETPDVYRDWKRGLRAELAAAAAAARELERRVARLLGEPSEPSAPLPPVCGAQPDAAPLPLLDLLALARESAERTRERLAALARQLRASAMELGVLADPQCMGELVPLRLAEQEDDGVRPGAVLSVLNWLYAEGERVACGRPVLRYEVRDRRGREQRTLSAPRSGVLARIAVASGSPPPGDAPLGVLRVLPGMGVELSDRLENSRAEETELRLSARRSARESGVAGRRAAFWAAAAAALLVLAVATWQSASPAPAQEALRTGLAGLCVAPALYAALQALRELGSARRAQQRLGGLGDQIAQAERELARLWDEFRLLGDRFARAVASFEEGLPAAPLFAAPAAGGRSAPRGALLRVRPGEAGPSLTLDTPLFPPELAAHLPAPAASTGAALYRVTESGPGGARAARWASYFTPGD